jgi:hypothetical protein
MISVIRERVVKKGRPHSLGLADCLGLVLGYTKTKGSLSTLQMVFGATPSVLCIFLKYSMRLLLGCYRRKTCTCKRRIYFKLSIKISGETSQKECVKNASFT